MPTTYIMVDTDDTVVGYVTKDEPPIGPYAYYEVTDKQALSGATPTMRLKWNSGTPVWVETATLAQLKAAKNEEINTARMAANFTTFPYAGKQISCDTLSRSDIDGMNGYVSLTGALPANWAGQWKAADNTYVPITTVDNWKAFYGAMVAQGQTNFAHAQSLKASLANAATAEEVASIVVQF